GLHHSTGDFGRRGLRITFRSLAARAQTSAKKMAEKVPWTLAYPDWPLKSKIKNQKSRIEKWLCSFPSAPLKRKRPGRASQEKSKPAMYLRWSEILARAKPNWSKDWRRVWVPRKW